MESMETDRKILLLLALMIPLTIRFLVWKEISRFPQKEYPTKAVFAGNFMDGSPCKPEDFDGKVVLLYFFAVWAGPAQDEIQQTLLDLYQQYHGEGLEIIGVSCCSDAQDVKKYAAQNNLPWKVMSSEEVISKRDTVSNYYMYDYVPYIIVVGRDGKIVSRDVRGTALVEIVEKELKRKKQN